MYNTYTKSDVENTKKIGKIVGITLATRSTGNITVSQFAANNAVDHGFIPYAHRLSTLPESVEDALSDMEDEDIEQEIASRKEKIETAKRTIDEEKTLTDAEKAKAKNVLDSILEVILKAESLENGVEYEPRAARSAPLTAFLFKEDLETYLRSDLSQILGGDGSLDSTSFTEQALVYIDETLTQFEQESPNAAFVVYKSLEYLGVAVDCMARLSVGAAGFAAGEAICPTGGGFAGLMAAETAYEGVTSAASAAVEETVKQTIEHTAKTYGPRAAKAAQNLIQKGFLIAGATGVAKGIKGVKVKGASVGSAAASELGHIRPESSPNYSCFFKAQLQEGLHYPGKSRGLHFQEANKQLYQKIMSDKKFAVSIEKLYPGITEAVSPGARGAFPRVSPLDLTWHHNPHQKGVLDLLPTLHHESSGIVQSSLHPGGKGGQFIWGGGLK